MVESMRCRWVWIVLGCVASSCSAATLKSMREHGRFEPPNEQPREQAFYRSRTHCSEGTASRKCEGQRGDDWTRCMEGLDEQCDEAAAQAQRDAFRQSCVDVGGQLVGRLWAAHKLEEWTPRGEGIEGWTRPEVCSEPDADFLSRWGDQATYAIRERMQACLSDARRSFAECEASLADAFAAVRAEQREAVQPQRVTPMDNEGASSLFRCELGIPAGHYKAREADAIVMEMSIDANGCARYEASTKVRPITFERRVRDKHGVRVQQYEGESEFCTVFGEAVQRDGKVYARHDNYDGQCLKGVTDALSEATAWVVKRGRAPVVVVRSSGPDGRTVHLERVSETPQTVRRTSPGAERSKGIGVIFAR